MGECGAQHSSTTGSIAAIYAHTETQAAQSAASCTYLLQTLLEEDTVENCVW